MTLRKAYCRDYSFSKPASLQLALTLPFAGSYRPFCCFSYDLHLITREDVSYCDYWPGTSKYRHRRKISFMKIGVFS